MTSEDGSVRKRGWRRNRGRKKERVRKMELAVSGNEEEREATAELIAVTMKKAEGSEGEILSN